MLGTLKHLRAGAGLADQLRSARAGRSLKGVTPEGLEGLEDELSIVLVLVLLSGVVPIEPGVCFWLGVDKPPDPVGDWD